MTADIRRIQADFALVDARMAIDIRNVAITGAAAEAILALALAAVGSMGGAFLITLCGAGFALFAARDHRRADALFARGIAAALAEGNTDVLAEAA